MYAMTCLGRNGVFCWDVFIFPEQTGKENLPICAVVTQLSRSTDGDSSQLPPVLDPQGSLPCLSGGGGGDFGFQEKHQPASEARAVESHSNQAVSSTASSNSFPFPKTAKRGAGS